ncbi:hypothetical protein CANTEDRAFT_95858 [Yamadazyma tenuis ATCC 10573]|uniref:Protein STU1 n=2 Tax=Candida tenuis TaxID=2315449 RepID=G3BDX8_CANTC|nr:uncharacterized protein CANTEDRAFT_95858 [Yamadazyma tenuis ATCC 10573]EGV60406.1 hypothetical protein CANTEDRAFT_95858 [Yamadazyma tenuis ATCC 10573]
MVASSDVKTSVKIEYLNDLRLKIRESKGDKNSPILSVRAITNYIQGLQILDDMDNMELARTSFRTLSDLLKYAAIGGKITKEHARSVFPILISRLGDHDSKISASAEKRLDDIWLINNKEVQHGFEHIAFPHRNPDVVIKSLSWLLERANEYIQFNLERLILSIVKAINDNYHQSRMNVVNAFLEFLATYFMSHNDPASHKLAVKEVYSTKVEDYVRDSILNAINKNPSTVSRSRAPVLKASDEMQSYGFESSKKSPKKSTGDIQSELRSPFEVQSHHSIAPSEDANESISEASESESDLQAFTSRLDSYGFDDSIHTSDTYTVDDLHRLSRDLLPVFEGNETENNWQIRERNIMKIRMVLRSNVIGEFPEEFKSLLQRFNEAIRKALLSLRTTLSSNACQLIKESAMVLKESFDSLVDTFLPALIQVCSSNKTISTKNSHTAICAIIMSCSYSARFISKIDTWAADKNINLRAFTCSWLHIVFLRFHDFPNFCIQPASQNPARITSVSKTLGKLLADSNGTVRQAAREAFWSFVKYTPDVAESIFSKLDSNVSKGIERAAPSNIGSLSDIFETSKEVRGTNRSKGQPATKISSRISMPSRPASKSVFRQAAKPLPTVVKSIISRPATPNVISNIVQSRAPSRLSAQTSLPKRLGGSLVSDENSKRGISKLERSNSRNQPNQVFHSSSNVKADYSKPERTSSLKKVDAPVKSKKNAVISTNGPSSEHSNAVVKPISASIPTNTPASISISSKESPHKQVNPVSTSVSRVLDDRLPSLEFPLVYQLASSDITVIRTGIDTLKYALKFNETAEIPKNINIILSKLSRSHNEMLKPLFNYVALSKILPVFNLDDMLRVYFTLFEDVSESFVDELKSNFDSDKIYKAIDLVLINCLNCKKLLHSDPLFGEQVSIYKPVIIKSIIKFLSIDINEASSDSNFPIISNSVFHLINHISYESFDDYFELLTKVYSLNSSTFKMTLNYFESDYKSDIIELIQRIDNKEDVEMSSENDDSDDINLDDLIGQGENHTSSDSMNMHEVIAINDLNIGTRNNSQEQEEIRVSDSSSSEGSDKLQEEDAHIMSESKGIQLDTEAVANAQNAFSLGLSTDGKSKVVSVSEEDNVFLDRQSSSRNEIAEEFSQIDIRDRSSFEIKDPFQTLVEKVDPLKARAERNKQINIYEDSVHESKENRASSTDCSPRKHVDEVYDYSELNWFNFQLAHNSERFKSDVNRSEFENLTTRLGDKMINNDEVLRLINYLQSSIDFDMEFANYFYKEGSKKLEANLWKLFEKFSVLNKSQISNGLIIAKQLLITRMKIDLKKLIHTLVKLGDIEDESIVEFGYAISEIFEEVLRCKYPSEDILDVLMEATGHLNVEHPKNKIVMGFDLLLKFLIHYPLIGQKSGQKMAIFCNTTLYPLLSHQDIEVRRITVLNYGKILKSLQGANLDTKMIQESLSGSQKKLIEYYSKT